MDKASLDDGRSPLLRIVCGSDLVWCIYHQVLQSRIARYKFLFRKSIDEVLSVMLHCEWFNVVFRTITADVKSFRKRVIEDSAFPEIFNT